MSLIIPPRPNEASRPVIVKSVTASTRVPPPSDSCSVLTIVALAPPWPRLSLPVAASVAVCVPRRPTRSGSCPVGRGRRAELDLELAVVGAVVVVAGDRRAGQAGRDLLEVDQRRPHLLDRGVHLEGLLQLHRRTTSRSARVSMSRGSARSAALDLDDPVEQVAEAAVAAQLARAREQPPAAEHDRMARRARRRRRAPRVAGAARTRATTARRDERLVGERDHDLVGVAERGEAGAQRRAHPLRPVRRRRRPRRRPARPRPGSPPRARRARRPRAPRSASAASACSISGRPRDAPRAAWAPPKRRPSPAASTSAAIIASCPSIRSASSSKRRDAIPRQQPVEVRHGGLHPAGQRLVARVGRERVEPDEPVRRAAQPRRARRASSSGSPRSQPSDSSTTNAPRPIRRPCSRFSVASEAPIRVPPDQSVTRSAARCSAQVGVAPGELQRQPRELGAERERLDARARGDARLHVLEQHARVGRHRARDVEHEHQRGAGAASARASAARAARRPGAATRAWSRAGRAGGRGGAPAACGATARIGPRAPAARAAAARRRARRRCRRRSPSSRRSSSSLHAAGTASTSTAPGCSAAGIADARQRRRRAPPSAANGSSSGSTACGPNTAANASANGSWSACEEHSVARSAK